MKKKAFLPPLTLVEAALAVALSFVLSFIKIELWAQGGSITALSMLPLLMISFRRGPGAGLMAAFVFGVIKLMLGFQNVLYCKTLGSQLLCIFLDYLIAYSVIGLAGLFSRLLARPTEAGTFRMRIALLFGCLMVFLLRFAAAFLSGLVLWGAYAPEGQPVWLYSLVYNGGYLSIEAAVTAIGCVLIVPLIPRAKK